MSPRLSLSLLFLLSLPAVLRGEEPNAKAARLLEPLARRPGATALFERFVNAWLDTGTLESLGEYLTKRAAADPSAGNRLLLAQFHTRQGQPVKALEQFRAALASDAGNAETWLLKGQTEVRMLDFTAAMESLKKCLAANPPAELAGRAAQLLGRVQARAGQTEAALATWSALMQSRPADEELREDILEIQIAESLWPAALENAAHLAEHTADAYKRVIRRMRLGDVQDRSGQRDKALETFASCLDDAGNGSWLEKEILAQIDKLFRREDDLSGLRGFLEKQAAAAPQRAGVQRGLAKLLMELGEAEAALAVSKRLMELTPGDRTAREEFIAMLTGAGRAAEAIPQVQQLIQASPNDAELRLVHAGLHHEVKNDAGALEEIRQFEKLAAADAGTPVRVAALLEKYGMMPEAVQSLRAAVERDKGRLELRQMLAAMLHKSGEKPAAIAEWTALAVAGDLPVALQAVRAMLSAGEAEAAWALMLQLVPQGQADALFLTQLAVMAETEARAREALPAVRALVDMAKSAPDLDAALDAVLRVARKGNAVGSLTAALRDSAATAPQFCLLAVLLEAERDAAGAAAALEKAKGLNAALALSQMVRLRTMRGDFAGAAQAAEEMWQSAHTVAAAELLTSLHRRAGNAETALQWVQEWRKLAPGSAAPVLEEAALLQAEGREAEAVTALRAAAGRMEQNADIRARLAAAYAAAGQSADAMRLYSALYEEANDLAAKMRWLQPWAETARGAGQLEELIAQFDERRRENRASTAPLMALAELHRMADNYEERRKALTEAQQLKPDDEEILIEIARLEEREGRRDEGIATLRAALPKDKTGRIAQQLSEFLIAAGAQEEGLALLKAGKPTPAQVLQLAATLQMNNSRDAALKLVKDALTTWPGDWELESMAAGLESAVGARREAVQRCLRLLEFKPRSGPPPVAAGPAGFQDLLIASLPARASTLLRLVAWREQRSNAMRMGRGGRSLRPLSQEDVPYFAAVLIAQSLSDLPREERKAVSAEMAARGFGAAELLLEIPRTNQAIPTDSPVDAERWLKERAGDLSVLSFGALSAGYWSWETAPSATVAQAAWKALQQDAPEAALFFALPAAGFAKPGEAWAQEVLSAAEARADSTPLLTMAVIKAALLDNDRADRKPPARERMTALLQRWLMKDQAKGQGFAEEVRNSAFTALSREFLRAKNLPALQGLLEHEWRAGGDPVLVIGQNNGSLSKPLGFPPAGLSGVPEQIMDFLREDGLAAVASDLAALVQEPVLRLLLLGKASSGALETEVAALLTARPGDAAPLVLAASLAEKRGDFKAAGEYAVKAQFLPLHPAMRRQLDSALAWWAQRQSSPGDALYAAGREAALRLRRDALDADDRTELATLMDTLGLTEEADRLMRQGKAASAGSAGGVPLERVDKLLREGRSTEALPLMLQLMRGWAQMWMSGPADLYGEEELAHWRTLAYAGGLMPAVEKAMQPANPTPRQLAEYAALCDLAMRVPEALAAAERAVAAAPAGNWHLRWRLLRLQLRAEPDKAAQHFLASGLEWNNEVLDLCRETLMENQTLETVLQFARMIDGALKASPERAGVEFPVTEVLNAISSSAACGRYFSVSAHAPPELVNEQAEELPAGERERVAAMAKERDEIYGRVARILLTRPGCGMEAWELLRGVSPPGELLSQALGLAAERLTANPDVPGFNAEQLAEKLTLLAMDAVEAGRAGDFEKQVLQPWLAGPLAEHAEALKLKWPMLSGPPAEFAAAAAKYLESEEGEAWAGVLEAARVRRLGEELTPQLLAELKPEHERAEDARENAPDWADLLFTLHGAEAAVPFMRAALQAVTVPPAPDAEKEGPRADASMIESLSRDASLLPLLLDVVEQERWRFFDDRCLEYFVDSKPKPEVLRDVFSRLGFGGGPGDLLVTGSVAVNGVPAIRGTPQEREARGAGGPVEKLGFGWQVLYLGEHRSADWWSALAHWQPQLAALPEPRRAELLPLLKQSGDDRPARTPAGLAFRQWVYQSAAEEEKKEMEEKIAEFLRDAEAGEMDDADTLQQGVSGLVGNIFFTTPPRMKEVVERAAGIARKLSTEDAYAAVAGGVVDDIDNDKVDAPQAAWRSGLAMQAAQQGMSSRYLFGYHLSGAGGRIMQSSDDSVEGRLAEVVRLAGPEFTGPARLWVLCWLLDTAGSDLALTAEETTARALRWVEQHRAENPALLGDMESALRIRRDVLDWTGRVDAPESEWPAGMQRLLAALRDEQMPAPVRLMASAELLDDFTGPAPRLLVEECERLLIQAHRDRLPVHRDVECGVCVAMALLPDAQRDAALLKELLPVLQIARPRDEISDYSLMAGMNALLDMALCAGDTAVADRLLEAEGIFPNQVTLGVLARRGDSARLAALVQARPDVVQNNTGWGMEYDDLLHSRLPAVLEAVANEDDRLLLRAVLTALPDGKNAAAFPRRAERVAALAPAVVAREWRSPLLRDRALGELTGGRAMPPVLQPLLDDVAARVPFNVVWGLKDRAANSEEAESTLYSRLHAARLHASLSRGDMAPLLEVLRAYRALPAQAQAAGQRRRETLMDAAAESIFAAWNTLSPEQRTAVCAGWREGMELLGAEVLGSVAIFSGQRFQLLSSQDIFNGLRLHLLADQEAVWEQWSAQRDPAFRAYLTETISDMAGKTEEFLPQGRSKIPGTPEDQLRTTASLFARIAKYTLWRATWTLDDLFLRENMGPREDFMKLEPGVLAAAGEQPWTVFAFARCLARMERWPDVLARTEKALAALPPAGDSAWLPLVELHVQALDHTGRSAEKEAWLAKARAVELPLDAKFASRITGAYRRLVK